MQLQLVLRKNLGLETLRLDGIPYMLMPPAVVPRRSSSRWPHCLTQDKGLKPSLGPVSVTVARMPGSDRHVTLLDFKVKYVSEPPKSLSMSSVFMPLGWC